VQISSINSAAEARRVFAAEAGASPAAKSAQPNKEQIRAAARQFEAIILRQLLSPAIEPLMSNGLGTKAAGQGGGGGVYGYLATDALANSLSQGSGLGLAKILEKQLTPKGTASAAQAAAAYHVSEVKS
jgi:peptidoglycan hydrolase FlgJ